MRERITSVDVRPALDRRARKTLIKRLRVFSLGNKRIDWKTENETMFLTFVFSNQTSILSEIDRLVDEDFFSSSDLSCEQSLDK